jgi:ribosomal protein S27AE
MTEESYPKATYVCRRCGQAYSFKDYGRSHFCGKCGALLKKASTSEEVLKPEAKREGRSDFPRLLKKFFPYPSFRPF